MPSRCGGVTGVSGECRVQRLVLPGGERSWMVLGSDHRPVGPAGEFLEYLGVQRVSPNTVKSYARVLALWWQYLEAFGVAWDAVTREHAGRFLAWLRTGDGPEVVSIERRPARFAESAIAARLQAVLSCYRCHHFNGVAFGGDLIRLVNGRGGYKPVLGHVARRAGRRQAVIRVRRPGKQPPPLLTPGQIERICDACACWDAETRQWQGCVRDRLLRALTKKIHASRSAEADPGRVLACGYARGSGARRAVAGTRRGACLARSAAATPARSGGTSSGRRAGVLTRTRGLLLVPGLVRALRCPVVRVRRRVRRR
jgi:hypothetical protein